MLPPTAQRDGASLPSGGPASQQLDHRHTPPATTPRRLVARMGLCASSLGPVPDAASFHDLPALPDIDGKPVDFAQFKGKASAGSGSAVGGAEGGRSRRQRQGRREAQIPSASFPHPHCRSC